MNFKLLEILNANVYLTNILVLPSIILTYLISNDIKSWQRKDKYKDTTWSAAHVYEYFWDTYFWITVIAFILSNLYHVHMFADFSLLKQIGRLDGIISAPLNFVIMVVLIIMYYVYLHNTNKKNTEKDNELKKATVPIFRLGIFFIIIGGISWILKKGYYNYHYYDSTAALKTAKDQAIWTSGHIFFHYMCYTGGLLIVLLYYIENKDIYMTLKQTMLPNNTKD